MFRKSSELSFTDELSRTARPRFFTAYILPDIKLFKPKLLPVIRRYDIKKIARTAIRINIAPIIFTAGLVFRGLYSCVISIRHWYFIAEKIRLSEIYREGLPRQIPMSLLLPVKYPEVFPDG